MEALKIAVCLLALATVLSAKEIPSTNPKAAHDALKEKLAPHFASQNAKKGSASPFTLDVLPVNVAVYKGENVTFVCGATPGTDYRVQWWEFVYSSAGNIISEGTEIIAETPEAARYSITQTGPDSYNLHIRAVKWEDAGIYICEDVLSGPGTVYRGGIQLIVIDSTPNCTTTLAPSGVVIEGQYHTAECTLIYNGAIVPIQTWTGQSPFNVGRSSGQNSIWAGISWIVDRTMDTKNYICINNFTNNFEVAEDMSPHVPDWYYIYQTNQMFVYWGPMNMYVVPIKDFYHVGDVLTCYADAYPEATYTWHNHRTNEKFSSQEFVVGEELLGTTQDMRCQAQNIIQGFPYSGNIIVNVTVIEEYTGPTSPPTTTRPTSPTTRPPGSCGDLTGRWESTYDIPASLCLHVDNTDNGHTIGILRNDTDTFWIEVVGRTEPGIYDLVGFAGIWPDPVGVSGFVGECHGCEGQPETLLINDIQRVKGRDQCGLSGPLYYSPQYTFFRAEGDCVELTERINQRKTRVNAHP